MTSGYSWYSYWNSGVKIFTVKREVELVKESMNLPDSERAHLVDELLETLEPEREGEVDKAWAAEVWKREADILCGKVKHVIWEEVKIKAVGLEDSFY